MWSLVVAAVVATHADPHYPDYVDGSPPAEDVMCYSLDDCPSVSRCYEVACSASTVQGGKSGQGVCQYTRLPVDECCLSSEECCAFSGPNEIGICDKNCTCAQIPIGQCTDESCAATVGGLFCAQQGACFYSSCEVGGCKCRNGTGLDLDMDGVACPDDCDDLNAAVQNELVCFRDVDNDHYPDCAPYSYEQSASHHHQQPEKRSNCMRFCVATNETCPYGWTDPSDTARFDKHRSLVTEGEPCTLNVTAVDECDCCDIDPRAFPGSMYAANELNKCGDADYNCDDETTNFACCDDGQLDNYYTHHHGGSSPASRTLWYANTCAQVAECGGCATQNNSSVLTVGWACEEECVDDSLGGAVSTRKRNVNECPSSCTGECVCVDAQTPPMLGECAKAVTSCLEVRPHVFGDAEECCAVAIQ